MGVCCGRCGEGSDGFSCVLVFLSLSFDMSLVESGEGDGRVTFDGEGDLDFGELAIDLVRTDIFFFSS